MAHESVERSAGMKRTACLSHLIVSIGSQAAMAVEHERKRRSCTAATVTWATDDQDTHR